MNLNDMIGKWIMGCTEDGPIAGKVIEVCQPQYPSQDVSFRVSWIEGYEGWLYEGQYIWFNTDKWNYILNEWDKIIIAKENIRKILTY